MMNASIVTVKKKQIPVFMHNRRDILKSMKMIMDLPFWMVGRIIVIAKIGGEIRRSWSK